MTSFETNIFEGSIPALLRCNSLSVQLPSLDDHSSQAAFVSSLYRSVRKNTNAFPFGNRIYFIGEGKQLEEDLQPLEQAYPQFKIDSISRTNLILPRDIRIVRNLLYYAFEQTVGNQGYAVRFRRRGDKVAVPSFETLQNNATQHHLVEYTAGTTTTVHLIESFFYRLNVLSNGTINLVIDPKLTVLVPPWAVPHDVLERSYLSVLCFQDSSQSGGCELLHHSSMKYVGEAMNPGLPDSKCVRAAKRFYEVVDVKNQQDTVLPANILFVEGYPSSLGIQGLFRKRALKSSRSRRELTQSFASHLADFGDHIVVPLGEEQVTINSHPVTMPMSDAYPTGPLSMAKLLGEPRLVVTNSPMYVAPKDALNSDGPYSRNNSQTVPHPANITLHTIFPKNFELAKTFVQRLVTGCSGYAGFSSAGPPFYSNINPLYYPVEDLTLVGLSSVVSSLRDKVQRTGHVIFVVLPDAFTAYVELKALCYQHALASQFIKEGTIKASLSGRALAFYLWNLGIAVYAKAGGTPWRIDNSLLDHTDCYVGIQTKVQQVGRAAPSAFFVGAADIFNSMGEYLSTAVHQGISKSVDGLHVDSDFMKALVNTAIARYHATVGLLPKRIIIHRQLNFDRNELSGLAEGLDASGAKCPCIIVHLQEGHHFRGYLLDDGDLTVERSTYFPLGKSSVVLFTTGKSQDRYEGGLGTPKPTQVNIRTLNTAQEPNAEELEKVCKSILGFTRLRWNTTRVGIRRPLTVYAADKIGEMAKSGFANLQYRDIRDLL